LVAILDADKEVLHEKPFARKQLAVLQKFERKSSMYADKITNEHAKNH
jgi:hypothetical protein